MISHESAVASGPIAKILQGPGPIPHPSVDHEQYKRDLKVDLSRLRRLLKDTLRKAGCPPSSEEELRILNLACGSCNEAEVLAETLPELFAPAGKGSVAPRASLVGVDLREREVGDALARCRAWLREQVRTGAIDPAKLPNFEFLSGDATKVASHREIGEKFDVVFLRHQNFYDGADTWRKIFDQGLEKLSPDGLLVFTSYFDREHKLALKAFQDLGGEVVATQENPEARALSTPGKVIDKHMAIVRAAR